MRGIDELRETHEKILDRVRPKSDSEYHTVEALRARRDELSRLRERRAVIEKQFTVLMRGGSSFKLDKQRSKELAVIDFWIKRLETDPGALGESPTSWGSSLSRLRGY